MYLSAYRFTGNPALLTVAYERLISEFDLDGMLLQACAVGEAGVFR